MKVGFRTRVFLVSLAIVVGALLLGGAWAEHSLRRLFDARIEADLTRLASAAQLAVQREPFAEGTADTERFAQDFGRATGVRLTLVRDDGLVLGESQVAQSHLAEIENHRERPEVLAALGQGRGLARRYSATLKTDMLYVAVPFQKPGLRGVARVAMPLSEVDALVWRLRGALVAGAIVALALSMLASGVSARYVARSVRDMFVLARTVARRSPLGAERVSDGGDIDGLVGSINTMAREFEETVVALGRERDRFGAVLEGMSEAVVALDRGGRITLSNQAAAQMLGWTDTPVGTTLLETIRQPALHDLAMQASGGEASSDEVEVALRSGARLLARAARLSSTEGGAVLVMRDVTALRRLENTRRDFVANVSHELRTPVSTIRATAETLLSGALDDPEHATKFLQALVRNAERLSRIISDLLDLSRIEAGEYKTELQAVGVRTAMHRVVETVEGLARQKGIGIASDIPEGMQVVADEQALEHVLLNLLDNAVKYTPAGGHVVVAARRQGAGQVRLEVRDDGPGIDPKYRARVFERFYRLDPGRSRDLGGTGLGLSIVRNLMTLMHGTVGVEGAEPRGTVFWIVLPVFERTSIVPAGTASPLTR